jgi:hypothetical protein
MEADYLIDLCLRGYSYGYSAWVHLAQKSYVPLEESSKCHNEYWRFVTLSMPEKLWLSLKLSLLQNN